MYARCMHVPLSRLPPNSSPAARGGPGPQRERCGHLAPAPQPADTRTSSPPSKPPQTCGAKTSRAGTPALCNMSSKIAKRQLREMSAMAAARAGSNGVQGKGVPAVQSKGVFAPTASFASTVGAYLSVLC